MPMPASRQQPEMEAKEGKGDRGEAVPSNEEQTLYDLFVAYGVKLAHAIGGRIKGNASVWDLGNALFYTVSTIEREGAENGIRFPLPVLLHGSNEILGHLVEATMVDLTEGQVAAVVGVAVSRYLEHTAPPGRMTRGLMGHLAQQAQGRIGEQFGRFQLH